jgi:hypothetical protein
MNVANKSTGGMIGILGGMGPMATVDFMTKIIEQTPAQCDQDHLPLIVYSVPQIPDRTRSILGEGESPLPHLLRGLSVLRQAGAACIAMPCNTAHYWFDTLQRESGSVMLHIADAACQSVSRQAARSFIYSTAPPAPVAAAAAKAVEILGSDEGTALLRNLRKNIRHLGSALGLPESPSAIVPIILGEESAALAAAEKLLASGFLAPAVRYPTVARNAARLRVTLSAAHTEQDIAGLAEALKTSVARAAPG